MGDEVRVKEKSQKNVQILSALEISQAIPAWLEVDPNSMTGKVLALPKREDITMPIEEHMIVELYSK